MKVTLFSVLIVLCIALTLVPRSFAQDSPQWHLPDGTTARLGKGAVYAMQFSSDGTRLAVASSPGIWNYDTQTGKVSTQN